MLGETHAEFWTLTRASTKNLDEMLTIKSDGTVRVLKALGIQEKRKAIGLHKCALGAANRSLERLGESCCE